MNGIVRAILAGADLLAVDRERPGAARSRLAAALIGEVVGDGDGSGGQALAGTDGRHGAQEVVGKRGPPVLDVQAPARMRATLREDDARTAAARARR